MSVSSVEVTSNSHGPVPIDVLCQLLEFTELLRSGSDSDAIVEHAVDAARTLLGADMSAVHLGVGRDRHRSFVNAYGRRQWLELEPEHRFHGQPVKSDEAVAIDNARLHPMASLWPSEHPDIGPYISTPLICHSHELGALCVGNLPESDGFGPEDLTILGLLGRHAASTMESAVQRERDTAQARLLERRQIAESLHETLAQRLFIIGLEARWLQSHAGLDAGAERRLDDILRLASGSANELRHAMFTLRSPHLPNGSGLAEIMRDQVAEFRSRTGVSAMLVVPKGFPEVAEGCAETLLRVVHEGLSNVQKHARASAVVVSLRPEPDGTSLTLTIEDDGIGMPNMVDDASVDDRLHFGIATMHKLAKKVGGQLEIVPADGRGTVVRARLPLQPDAR